MEIWIIVFVIAILCVAHIIDKYNKNKEEVSNYNAKFLITAEHIAGLPLGEQSQCKVILCEDKIIFESIRTKATYNLSMDKILDINIKTEEEIQTSYSSSIGGAIGGAVLFGPLGAMIGGRSKKKVDKLNHEYLIFTYDNKENKTDYISFDVTNNLTAHKFVKYFSSNYNKNIVTNL